MALREQDCKHRQWCDYRTKKLDEELCRTPGLTHNQSLEELNLAGNQVSSFREILSLSRLSSLRSLSFSDPHFGDNPICKLCNYQTYVTFHLSQLNSLDMELISGNAKRLAKAIYLKKKMYYNMRVKTLKRYATNVIRHGEEMHTRNINPHLQSTNLLLRLQKVFSCQGGANQVYSTLQELSKDAICPIKRPEVHLLFFVVQNKYV